MNGVAAHSGDRRRVFRETVARVNNKSVRSRGGYFTWNTVEQKERWKYGCISFRVKLSHGNVHVSRLAFFNITAPSSSRTPTTIVSRIIPRRKSFARLIVERFALRNSRLLVKVINLASTVERL